MSWRWIDKRMLLLLHDESLAEYGGESGLRDEGLLDSALARPINMVALEDPDFADLAAAYAFGLSTSGAFVDGNKRIGFLAAGLFLSLNGLHLLAPQPEATLAMLALAEGEMPPDQFAKWIRKRCIARSPSGVNERRATYRP